MTIGPLIAFAFALATSSALAGPWQDAQDLIKRGDVARALPLLVQAANAPSDPNALSAQFALGCYYEAGTGTKPDFAMAARWYRRAAESGHSQAQVALASMLAAGRGVAQDYTEAARWLAAAAAAAARTSAPTGVRPD